MDKVITNLDKQVSKILHNFEQDEDFANYLSKLPLFLFQLRRGPLLGPILQHADDIDYCRCLFLQAPLNTCMRFIDPPFFQIETGDIHPVCNNFNVLLSQLLIFL